MPRNNTNNRPKTPTFSGSNVQSMIPRMSYTGPIMPRPTPIDVKPPSFGQSVKEGFSLGIGMSFARNLVDGLFGNKSAPTTSLGPNKAPLEQQLAYQQCLKDGGDHEKCKDTII
jgi:hypothetical protein